MSERTTPGALETIYNGWDTYQEKIVTALKSLTTEQLEIKLAPNLRSIGTIAAHMVGARSRWLVKAMGEGGPEIEGYAGWGRDETPLPTPLELVEGFQLTWQCLHECLLRWSAEDLAHIFTLERGGVEHHLSRQWIVWHLIEHDLHHGGELSFCLGARGLQSPDI